MSDFKRERWLVLLVVLAALIGALLGVALAALIGELLESTPSLLAAR